MKSNSPTRLARIRRQLIGAAALATAAAIALSGCTSSSGTDGIDKTAPTKLSGTVSLWHFFTGREAKVIQSVVDGFEKLHPGVHVSVHSGQDDTKLQQAISAGNNVDVGLSYSTDIVGAFCSSGAFRDLTPYIKRDHVDISDLTPVTKSYTEFDGKRCAMPALSDDYGLYYNTDELATAGITSPPKTLSELETDALKLTTYNPDGSIKTLGFDPVMGFYENAAAHYAPATGAKWLDSKDKSVISSDPGWSELIKWQTAFVQKIGYAKLKAFNAAAGQEFSAANAFQKGKLAMNLDGEWRTAFIADQAPKLKYGTAPFPTADDHTDLYGGGYITGNIAGIAKGSKNPELAWALLKYLTTNTAAVVKMANGLKNVPHLTSALQSSDLEVDSQYKTFIDVAGNPSSLTTPASPVGAGYQTTFEQWWEKYQETGTGSIAAGLKTVDQQINASEALAAP
ncbi:MAG TPA: extracellular solute-binding protein [Galbitalea sp.]|jgi:multiple sugar transport system substrate-binding protein|nr:extracellular solute-binding protein [Galbitalea sp.]